jgi:hypothetical protein
VGLISCGGRENKFLKKDNIEKTGGVDNAHVGSARFCIVSRHRSVRRGEIFVIADKAPFNSLGW